MCAVHYQRWLNHGDPDRDRPLNHKRSAPITDYGTCADNGCDPRPGRGLCPCTDQCFSSDFVHRMRPSPYADTRTRLGVLSK